MKMLQAWSCALPPAAVAFFSILAACTIAGHEGDMASSDGGQHERVRKVTATWKSSPWLAARHGSKASLSCEACHQKQLIPDDNESVVNTQCVACHGSYDTLAPVTKAKLQNPDINPHASHLGPEIACTVCHRGHEASKPYCVNCHTNFTMPMPGSADTSARPAAAK
ncbi:MAG: cytochrome c3 family protein [Burkholderiales bacterium]